MLLTLVNEGEPINPYPDLLSAFGGTHGQTKNKTIHTGKKDIAPI